jgi:hypothetical protein
MDRLALGLSLSPKPPRADRDIGAFIQRIKKLGGAFDWRRQVGIAEDEDLALSIEYCVADTVTLAAVPGILTKRTIGSLAAKARMISAAVLSREPSLQPRLLRSRLEPECSSELSLGSGEAGAFVVGWDDEAVFRQRGQSLAVTVSDSTAGTEKLPDQDFAIVFASARCTRGARRSGTWGRLAHRRQVCYAVRSYGRLRKCLTILQQ